MGDLKINSNRKTSITFGVLLIAGMLFGILSSVPALEHPDYLIKLSSIKMQVLMAAFFQFTQLSQLTNGQIYAAWVNKRLFKNSGRDSKKLSKISSSRSSGKYNLS